MPVHSGECVKEACTIHCDACDKDINVKKGEEIPRCSCGAEVFRQLTGKLEVPGNRHT